MSFSLLTNFRLILHDAVFRLTHGGETLWRVDVDDHAFNIVKNNRIRQTAKWQDVDVVFGEKRDELTIEGVYLIFHTEFLTLRVEESYEGFEKLLALIRSKYPEMDNDWYRKLNEGKPFQNKQVLVWKK